MFQQNANKLFFHVSFILEILYFSSIKRSHLMNPPSAKTLSKFGQDVVLDMVNTDQFSLGSSLFKNFKGLSS